MQPFAQERAPSHRLVAALNLPVLYLLYSIIVYCLTIGLGHRHYDNFKSKQHRFRRIHFQQDLRYPGPESCWMRISLAFME